jgi:excisionase family DNA binding protein
MGRFLTVREISEALRRSPDAVYRDVRMGRLPHTRVGPKGRLLFDIDEVRAALHGKGNPAPASPPAA